MPRLALVAFALPLAATTSIASAQTRSDDLAARWREARRAELLNDRNAARADLAAREAAIAVALKQLDRGATPDALDADPLPPIGANRTATTTQTELTTASDGSSQKTVITTNTSEESVPSPRSEAKNAENSETSGRQSFGGLDFGIGVSYTGDLGDNDRIGTAATDPNGIVRITDKNNVNARIMLESHYFFTPPGDLAFGVENSEYVGEGKDRGQDSTMWGVGPFIALRPGSDEVIDAIGAGIMVGFRRSPTSKESFNFGIGLVVDPNVRVLGEGILADRPLPPGETEVRYRETSQLGLLLLTSFSF